MKNRHKIIESVKSYNSTSNCLIVLEHFHVEQLFLGVLTSRVYTKHTSVSLDSETFIDPKKGKSFAVYPIHKYNSTAHKEDNYTPEATDQQRKHKENIFI